MAFDINASWSLASGATTYIVGIKVNGGIETEYTVTTNSFYLSGFSLNDIICVRVKSVNAYGQSIFGEEECVTIKGALPNQISGLTAVGVTGGIKLDWTDNSTNETGFRIYRSETPSGVYSLIHTTAPNIITYTDTPLNIGVVRYYKVVAVSPRGENPLVVNAGYVTDSAGVLPAAPTGFTATAQIEKIKLDWTDNATNEDGYHIYRSNGGGGVPTGWVWDLIHTTAANIETYTDDPLIAGVTRYYALVAYNGKGVSPTFNNAKTNNVSAIVLGNVPLTPVGFGSYQEDPRKAAATWSASVGATYYVVAVSVNGGAFVETNVGNTLSWVSGGNYPIGTEVCIKVKAGNDDGESAYTAVDCIEIELL